MQIMDMVLDTIKSALGYSADATQKVRNDFRKINADLISFGDHIKEMLTTVTTNLRAPILKLEARIAEGEAKIAKLQAPKEEGGKPDKNCGLGWMSR